MHISSDEEEIKIDDRNEEFEDFNSIQEEIAQIRRNTLRLEDCYNTFLSSPSEQQKANEELEEIITSTNQIAKNIRNKLQRIVNVDKNKKKNSTVIAMRKNLQSMMVKKFVEAMKDYSELQLKYKTKSQELLVAKYKLVKPTATMEEIEESIKKGGTNVFVEAILDMERKDKAKSALAYVKNRSTDIKRIEQSALELRDLFLELAIMVEVQDEIIEIVASNTAQAKENIKKAKENLEETNKKARKARKKMGLLIGLLIGVLAVVAGVPAIVVKTVA